MSEANTKTYHKRLSDSGLMRDGYMVREKKTPSRNDRCFVNILQLPVEKIVVVNSNHNEESWVIQVSSTLIAIWIMIPVWIHIDMAITTYASDFLWDQMLKTTCSSLIWPNYKIYSFLFHTGAKHSIQEHKMIFQIGTKQCYSVNISPKIVIDNNYSFQMNNIIVTNLYSY